MENKIKDPLLCNVETGVCEMQAAHEYNNSQFVTGQIKPVKIIYYTDPICSSCWGIEPQLRKLKLEYGHIFELEYRMGGLLPDWSYNSGGISKPADVADHWNEVSQHYDMPIDGDVWLEDMLHSSYPPSIAFKAAQLQDEEMAVKFLRRIREMVFLEKKNITKWEHLSNAATQSGLAVAQLQKDYETRAIENFSADLALTKQLGVTGFPTLFFYDVENKRQKLYGTKPYRIFEDAILKTYPIAAKRDYDKSWKGLFTGHPTLTTREFAELAGVAKSESEVLLQELWMDGKLNKTSIKNGDIWTMKNNN